MHFHLVKLFADRISPPSIAVVVLLFLVAACGGDPTPLSPTGPSIATPSSSMSDIAVEPLASLEGATRVIRAPLAHHARGRTGQPEMYGPRPSV